MTSRSRRCEKCKFYSADFVDSPRGECHRRAPLPAMPRADQALEVQIPVWARVAFNDWCGEYEAPLAMPAEIMMTNEGI